MSEVENITAAVATQIIPILLLLSEVVFIADRFTICF